jgi:hypothetical protein
MECPVQNVYMCVYVQICSCIHIAVIDTIDWIKRKENSSAILDTGMLITSKGDNKY